MSLWCSALVGGFADSAHCKFKVCGDHSVLLNLRYLKNENGSVKVGSICIEDV